MFCAFLEQIYEVVLLGCKGRTVETLGLHPTDQRAFDFDHTATLAANTMRILEESKNK